ncbi:hypothetical protein GCM10011506_00420 [Marivirga lumbricoides]|uniref:DUF4440 domain-containing protein n=2 Tax=Marivirga lumbricoides TaxID=1046115 RepID=A0ABQ1L4D1_9BACT|nr:hypothetical protein GCM10011506_00420 [Marivirga lumbricoides]
MKILFLITSFLFSLSFNETADNQKVLQQVLNIKEFKQYISKTPRYMGSQNHHILLVAHNKISKDYKLEINQIPVEIIDSASAFLNDKIFLIQIDEFEISDKKAALVLSYKNARLYFEEKKKIVLTADLKKTDNEWKVSKYKVKEVNISG